MISAAQVTLAYQSDGMGGIRISLTNAGSVSGYT
jgi:hypothetical protein